MITREAYRKAKVMRASGATAKQSLTPSESVRTQYKIGRGAYREPRPTFRCTECRAKLTAPDCLHCALKRQGRVRFRATSIPENTSDEDRERLERSLDSILPARVANFLQTAGIYTVNDILHRRQQELLAISGIGITSVNQILHALERLGFDTSKA